MKNNSWKSNKENKQKQRSTNICTNININEEDKQGGTNNY